MSLTVGALFAGYGGLELGLSQVLDTELRWSAEIEAAPAKVLAARWPDVPNLGDVTAVDWASVEPVDIITGGSPCQDLSHAGKRAGMKPGTRSGLWAAMCRAIDELRPSLVVWENVRGALSAEASCEMEPEPRPVGSRPDGPVLRALGRVLGDLAELGYDAGWCGLRAADVGAPHGRYRIFVVAWPADADADGRRRIERDARQRLVLEPDQDGDAGADLALLPTPNPFQLTSGAETPDGWRERRLDVHERTGTQHGPALQVVVASLLTDDVLTPATYLPREQRLLPSPTAEDAARSRLGTGTTLTDVLARDRHDELGRLLPTPQVGRANSGETYAAREGHQIEVGDVVAERVIGVASYFGPYTNAVRRWEAIQGHPAPPPTETTRANGLPRLSPRFVEWMMGVPPGWVDVPGVSHNGQLRMLGNGVVPAQAGAAIAHLLNLAAP